jgi:hypothetical protein
MQNGGFIHKARSVGVLRGIIRIKAETWLRLWRKTASGRLLVLDEDHLDPGNMVVTAGLGYIADQLLAAPTLAKMGWMAIGTGVVAPTLGDTALGTEANRQALASLTRNGSVLTYFRSFGAGQGTGAITEMGIFNQNSAGTMLCRQTFAAKNKGASDVLDITLTHTFS